MFKPVVCVLLVAIMSANGVFASTDNPGRDREPARAAQRDAQGKDRGGPDQVTIEHWTCREVAELGVKYQAERRLPDEVVVEGKPCPKDRLAQCLLSILEKVVDRCGKEGAEAVSREDLDRIAALHEALRPELARQGGYLLRREAIERILAKPEPPALEYKVGVNGFFRGEGTGNFSLADFGYTPDRGQGRFLYKVKPYAYWHPTDYLDIHLEGQGYGFSGGSRYAGKISLYQGFVDGRVPGSDLLALKVGRQEFNYGSGFVLGPDSFYDGLSFDAVRLRVKPLEPLTIDLLAGLYATPWSDGLKGNLLGAYATYALSEGNAVEAYGFRDTGSEEHHSGEHLDTWGLRATAQLGPVSLEFEPVYQSGRVFNSAFGANDGISAFGGHLDATVETELFSRKSTFFTSFAYGSGSREAAEGGSSRREFRNPNNDNALVGDMSVIGDMSGVTVGDYRASGLQIYTLGWGMDLTDRLNLSATGRYFIANYVPQGFSRSLGLETDFTLTYALNDNLSLTAGYDRFFTGAFFRDASGSSKDIHYGYLMLQFDLAKEKKRPARI